MVHTVDLEARVTGITPQNGRQTQFMCLSEGLSRTDQLPPTFVGAEIHRRTGSYLDHSPSLFDRSVHHLIEFIGEGEQFVVVDLDDKGDAISVRAHHCREDANSCIIRKGEQYPVNSRVLYEVSIRET